MPRKRSLAEELAELAQPAPAREVDLDEPGGPSSLGLLDREGEPDLRLFGSDDEDEALRPKRRARETRRLRAGPDVGSDTRYAGRSSSRAALGMESDDEDEGGEGDLDSDEEDGGSGEDEEDEEDEEGEAAAAQAPAAPNGAPRGFGALPGMGAQGGMVAAGAQQAPKGAVGEWVGLQAFPAATQKALAEHLSVLKGKNMSQMLVLMLGKSGAGKSSTVNSVLGEQVVRVQAFQPDTSKPTLVSRKAHGFTLKVLDTPGLMEGDAVSNKTLRLVGKAVAKKKVDAVLYVDRLDCWRVDAGDEAVFAALTEKFGPKLWEKTTLVLTHGQLPAPAGTTYGDHVAARAEALRSKIREAAGRPDLELPARCVENSGRCNKNAEGEKVLPNQAPWLPSLFGQMAACAAGSTPYEAATVKVRAVGAPTAKDRVKSVFIGILGFWFLPRLFTRKVLGEDGYIR